MRAQRTISCGDLSLYADLEKKVLRFYYKDREITKGEGLHSSFLIKSIWHSLSSCEWQVKKEKSNFILNFHWKQLKLKQSWKLSFKNSALHWQVDFKASRPLGLKLLKFGLLLNSKYKSFFCGRQQGFFPDKFADWQDMFLTEPQARLCGLRKQAGFPAIVAENKQGLSCIIQNSDEENSCRILQLSLPKEKLNQKEISFSAKIDLLKEEELIVNYLKEEKRKFLKKQEEERQKFLFAQQKEEARLRESRTISSGNLSVFVDADSRSIRLYHKDVELTARRGMHSIFYTSEEGYDLDHCRWDINKVSSNRIILNLHYESISLLQIWELACEKDDSLKIKIEVDVQKSISFANQDMKIEFSDVFKSWATAYEQGNFDINGYINNIGPIKLKDNKISKIILEFKDKPDCAKLFFVAFSNSGRQIIDIYKRKEANKDYVCINTSLTLPSRNGLTKPGKYIYFDGKIALGNDFAIEKDINSTGVATVEKGDIKFIFDRGRGIISWKGNELTAGLGVYSSIRSGGIWYDSYQATWEVKHKDENKITIVGGWPHIPVSQTWRLEFVGKNTIFLDIDMRIYRSIELEFEQTNIMLLPGYKKWIAPNSAQGEFIDDYTKAYDILPFRFWYGKADKLSAFAETLPRVTFNCSGSQNETRGIIENTDSLYEARLLQYQKINQSEVNQGERQYFKGVIEIKDNE